MRVLGWMDKRVQPQPRAAVPTAGAAHRGDSSREGAGLALAHLPQRGPHSLLGLPGPPFTLLLLPLEALQRRQKPRRLWLAKYHGDCSFRRARPSPAFASWVSVGPPVPGWFRVVRR